MNEKSTKQEESNEETRERLLRKFRDRKLVRSRKSAFSQTALGEIEIYFFLIQFKRVGTTDLFNKAAISKNISYNNGKCMFIFIAWCRNTTKLLLHCQS